MKIKFVDDEEEEKTKEVKKPKETKEMKKSGNDIINVRLRFGALELIRLGIWFGIGLILSSIVLLIIIIIAFGGLAGLLATLSSFG